MTNRTSVPSQWITVQKFNAHMPRFWAAPEFNGEWRQSPDRRPDYTNRFKPPYQAVQLRALGGFLLILTSLVVGTAPVRAQALDDTAVKAFWSTLDAVWNARDAGRFSELFTTDASFTFVDSGLSLDARGPIHDFFVKQFSKQSPELRHETRVRESHSVGPGALAIDAVIEVIRSQPDPRSGATVLQTFAAFAVMTRSADQLQIRLLRVYRLPNVATSRPAEAPAVQPRTATQVIQDMITGIEKPLTGVAQEMPEDKYEFAPTEGAFRNVRNFARQIKHAAAVHNLVAASILAEPITAAMSDERGPDSVRTKAEVHKYLADSFAYLKRAAHAVDETNAFLPIKGVFGSAHDTRIGLIVSAVSHSSNHYGQVVEYLRMNGLVPPRTQ